MRNFKFSIVIPSFNDPRILETIDSINNQTIDRRTMMTMPESLGNFVALMDSTDIGQLFVPSSKREMRQLVPDYSQHEDGVDKVKVLMATHHTHRVVE